MKKLVFAMGSFAAIFLTSSCTADSSVETKNEKMTTLNKFSDSGTIPLSNEKDDPIPPKK